MTSLRVVIPLYLLFEHDLFRKPVATFRDHALGRRTMFGFGTEYQGLAFWLPLIWAWFIAFAVAMYVIVDGFDLGVGILFKAARDENWRDRMMFSVAPIWDGNETWLVLGGGGLLAVFHLAYAILMPALYLPLFAILIAPIFRGATFDFLTPFSLLTGVALILGYGLLGATWCVMKTTGELELWARRMAVRFLVGVIVAMAIVSLWVPFLGREIEARWFAWPNIAYLAPVPLLTALAAWRLYRGIQDGRQYSPFLLAIALFLLGYLGLAISLFPYIVPPNVTVWQAANTVNSQLFALVGFSIVMPLTFLYTGYAYWVFRGKVAEEIKAGGYH